MSQFQTMRLEDGEQVIRLRGGRGLQRKSDRPHAGIWGEKTHYALVPCRSTRQVTRRSKLALGTEPGLTNRSSDMEVLLLGSPEAIERLISNGPSWCRGLVSRKGEPRSAAQIAVSEALRAGSRDAQD